MGGNYKWGIAFTGERIENMIALIAVNNIVGFILCAVAPWFKDGDGHSLNVYDFGLESEGIHGFGCFAATFGGLGLCLLALLLHWGAGFIEDCCGEWMANFIVKKLKWSMNVALVSTVGFGIYCALMIKKDLGFTGFGPGFWALLQNGFYACVCLLLLLYYPFSPSESGSAFWNLYGLFGGNDDDDVLSDTDIAREKSTLSMLFGEKKKQSDSSADAKISLDGGTGAEEESTAWTSWW